MSNRYLYAALCRAAAVLVTAAARSHEIVGNRMFPATLAIDDPGVADELALPTVAISKTGDVPSVKQFDISGEYSKLITEDFAVSFSPTWTHLYAPGGPMGNGASGFQNIETTFKYRVFKNAEHEFVASVGLDIEWGRSGAEGVGADAVTTYTPTFYFGKGFGDLPPSLGWARPFALTAQLGHDRRRRSRYRRRRHRVQSARPGLGRLAAIQPALPQIRRGRSWPAGFRQPPHPAGRSVLADAGGKHLQFGHGDHRHYQSGRDLGRRQISGRRRGDDPGQPGERQQRRRHRTNPLFPRRHLSQLHRTADFRQ
jgi:hypothetical protein